MLKNLIKSKLALIVLAFGLLSSLALFGGSYFSHHDDLQVMRIFEMRKCLVDGQIPCRWVPDMGYGYGYPLFNYYSAFPYYLGAIFSFVVGYISAVKLLFLTAIVVAALGTYLLVKELTKDNYAAVVGSVFYTFTPYRALDIYVRGALAEIFALSLMPLVLYFVTRLLKTGEMRAKVGTALSLFALFATHNITTLLFIPVLVLWTFLFLEKENLRELKYIFLGILTSAFFVLPAFFEKNLVQTQNLTNLDLNFRGHFTTLRQIFWDRSWGYGASVIGDGDGISFQIGLVQWLVAVVAFLTTLKVLVLKKTKKVTRVGLLPYVLFGLFLASAFMSHAQSAFVWERIDLMKYIQFPWRFIGFASFFASLAAAYVVIAIPKKIRVATVAGLILLVFGLNIGYFKPEFYVSTNDNKKLSGVDWELQQKAAMLDYLPITALEPREPAFDVPRIEGGTVENFVKRSSSFSFDVNAEVETLITVPIFDFYIWEVDVNGTKVFIDNDNLLGLISFYVPSGESVVQGSFKNTSIRTMANMITLFGFGLLVYFAKHDKSKELA